MQSMINVQAFMSVLIVKLESYCHRMFVVAVVSCQQLSVHAAGAKPSPWLTAVSPTLPSHLIGLLSKDGADHAVDTWCWQALYLLQAQLSASHMDQILQHQAAQRVSIKPLLHCSRSRFCFLVGQQGCRACLGLNKCHGVAGLGCAVLCCAVLCLTVPHCASLCFAVLCCAVLLCASPCITTAQPC